MRCIYSNILRGRERQRAAMPNQISPEMKNRRSDILLELSEKNKTEYETSFEGEELQVLAEEILKKDNKIYLRGHTERYMDVCVSLGPNKSPEPFINSIIRTRYTRGSDCLIL